MPIDKPVIKITREACLKGGEVAGAYLDKLKKSDLAQLNAEEWACFCQLLVGAAFASAMGNIQFEAPPF